MSTSSCRPLSTYPSSTKACVIMQCCTSSPKSREFSRQKSDVLSCFASRCTGQLKSHLNRSLTLSLCNDKWLKSKKLITSGIATTSKMPSNITNRSLRSKILTKIFQANQRKVVKEIRKGERLRSPSHSLKQETHTPLAA